MNASSPVDQIKERLPIAEVVGSYVKLERAGGNFKARCPFHSEKTPSFFVSPARGSYHCFGCSRGGDIFSFVEEIEGVQFYDALKMLADKAGVELKSVNPKEKSEYDKLYKLMDDAAAYYEGKLKEPAQDGGTNEALLYLKKRGLTDETIRAWRIGLAGDSWSGLYDTLKKKGYSDEDMDKTGFIMKGDRGPYDRFRTRIMFPLRNASGKIVGFSGRIFLPHDKEKEKELAKYVNSPDTVLYNKSRVLYGYDRAKQAMMRDNTAVLVEGQMDLLMSHQAGISNTVALSGTALTEEHLRMIKRFADNLVLALDSDQAGFAASERAWKLAVSLGLDVKVAKMPEGLDPADYVLKDKDGFVLSLKNAKHIVNFLLESLKEKKPDQREFRLEVGRRVLPYIAEIGNKMDQAHFAGLVANELRLGEEHVWEEISKIRRNAGASKSEQAETKEDKNKGIFRKDVITRKIWGIIFWQKGKEEPTVDFRKAEEEYKELSKNYDLPKISEAQKKDELIFESEVYYASHENPAKELAELMRNLEMEILEERFNESMRELTFAEKAGDLEKANELLSKCQNISKKLHDVKISK